MITDIFIFGWTVSLKGRHEKKKTVFETYCQLPLCHFCFLQASNEDVSRKRGLIVCLTSIHNIHTSTGKSVGSEWVCVCLLDCLKGKLTILQQLISLTQIRDPNRSLVCFVRRNIITTHLSIRMLPVYITATQTLTHDLNRSHKRGHDAMAKTSEMRHLLVWKQADSCCV